jgi:hypothetical protein
LPHSFALPYNPPYRNIGGHLNHLASITDAGSAGPVNFYINLWLRFLAIGFLLLSMIIWSPIVSAQPVGQIRPEISEQDFWHEVTV